MPRRSVTMLASTLLLIALLCVSVLLPAPYSEMSPGPTYNTLGAQRGRPVISISGQRSYPAAGHLNMTTVQVTSADYRMNLVETVVGWLRRDVTVIPRANLYPDHQTEREAERQNAEEFASSQDNAKAAALRQLGYRVGSEVVVGSVVKGAPAQGRLHAGDVIVAVDGRRVADPQDVARLVTRHRPGQRVVFTVVPQGAHGGARRDVTVPTMKAPDGARAMVGITPDTSHTLPFPITIDLGDVGGPSAGLMFSLGIVDKLRPGDLTGGAFVAGTGTITDRGKVGPIGGIQMKTIAARDAGARYFLTPVGNCAEAAANVPAGLTLVKVGSLGDALHALADIRSGHTADLPRCGG